MGTTKRVLLGCLGMAVLALVAVGTLVVLNWDTVSEDLGDALDTQTTKTEATLFRWGELMSISAELKREYGVEPHMAYETGTGDRILSITFSNYRLPEGVATEGHAHEIAVFAVGKTNRLDKIDTVTVRFQDAARTESFSFALDELIPAQPGDEPAETNMSRLLMVPRLSSSLSSKQLC